MGLCSTPKERPTANEIALATQAGIRDQEFQEKFLPLEIQEVATVGSQAREDARAALIAGRTSADVAAADAEAQQTLRTEAAARGMSLQDIQGSAARNDISGEVGLATAAAGTEAGDRAGRAADTERLGAVRLGMGAGATSIRGLSNLARQDRFAASETLRARTQARRTRLGGIAEVATAGGLRFADDRALRRRRLDRSIRNAELDAPLPDNFFAPPSPSLRG
jgi:hypothetical protein